MSLGATNVVRDIQRMSKTCVPTSSAFIDLKLAIREGLYSLAATEVTSGVASAVPEFGMTVPRCLL